MGPKCAKTRVLGTGVVVPKTCARILVWIVASLTLSASLRAQPASPTSVEVIGAPLHPHVLPREPAVSGSVVRRERLEAPGLDAADVLRREAGVEVTQVGGFGSAATASLRGATAEQTPVYLAGIRLNDEVGGAVDLSTVPLWVIDHVEIYRGNSPKFVDELGIGGAILFEPKRPEPGTSGMGVGLGSFGSRSGFAWAGAGSETAATLVGLAATHADNNYSFADNRGTLFVAGDDRVGRQTNSDVSVLDGWLLQRLELARNVQMNVVANVTAREQGVPRLALLPSERARARYERVLAGISTSARFGGKQQHQLTLASSFISANSVYDDPAFELFLMAPRVENSGQRAAQKVAVRLELGPRIHWDAALDAAVDRLERRDGDVELSGASALTTRLANGIEYELARDWFVSPLVAFSCRQVAGSSVCEQGEPVGRVSISRRTVAFTSYASAGRYVRFPSLGEVYGTGLLVRGNSHLMPERGITAELGVRAQQVWSGSRIWADAAIYSRQADRLVSYVRNAQRYLVPINVSEAQLRGLESSLGAELGPHFETDFSLTLLDARDTTPDRQLKNDILPFHSRMVGVLAVEGRSNAHSPGWIDRTSARASLLYQSSRYADPAGLVVIPEQQSLDLEVGQGFSGEAVKARARVANVFDTERFDSVGYPLPLRSVFVTMEIMLK